MVEIALSIAVVAFALVGILGILPTGMTVQRDNRDDNVINQEGRYWLEVIRNGSQGLDDLTNFVEAISITNLTKPTKTVTFDMGAGSSALRPQELVSLLSTPKYTTTGETNAVYARVKAITGPAAEKGPLTNEFSFRYQLQVEITPSRPLPGSYVASAPGSAFDRAALISYNEAVGANLHDVRLILRWPLVQRGTGWYVGNNKKTFRARIAGTYQTETNLTTSVRDTVKNNLGQTLVVLAPNKFNVNP